MADNQRIMEAIIRIGGEMDNSVKQSMLKAGNAFTTLNKKCASFEKTVIKAGAAMAAAFAGAATAATVAFIKMGDDINKTMNDLAAKTGATGAELEAMSKSATELWKSGLGESISDVANALSEVKQTAGLTGKELENAAKYGLTLRDTFGFEMNETTRTAAALMKNFGISAEEAYGLITIGAQKGANKNGDLLDTLNEYSVHYKSLGLTADQFVAGLIKGAESGSWSVDKVGDAVKEFTIRSKDASKASLEAFQMIGLNGEEMTRAFANGGAEASKAFNTTVKALKAMKDPVKKNAAGVALFGTMFEDLEAGVLDTFESMTSASLDAEAALKQVAGVKYNDLGSSITQISRSLQAQLIPASQQAAAALQDKMPEIQAAIAKLEPIMADLAARFAEFIPVLIEGGINLVPKIIEHLKEAAKWLSENKDTIIEVGKQVLIAYGIFRTFGLIVGVINGVAAAYASLKSAVLAVKGAALVCKGAFVKLKAAQIGSKIATVASTVAMKAQAVATKAITAAQWLWNAALTANPIGLVIAAVAGLIAIGWVMYKNWDSITAWLNEKWQAFAEAFPRTAAFMKAAWEQFCSNIKLVWDLIANSFKTSWEVLKNVFLGIVALFKGDWAGFCSYFSSAGQAIIDGFKNAWTLLSEWFGGVVDFFRPAIDAIGNAFSGMWDGIKSTAVTVFQAIPALIKTPINAVIKVVNGVIDKINGIGFNIPDWVPGMGGKRFAVNVPKMPMLAAGGFTKGISIAGEAGTEAVISFDPAYRRENQGYLMTAAEMLGMTAVPSNTSNTTINLGGLTFSPVIQTGDNVDRGNIMQQLRACIPDLLDLIENGLRERETHRYV
jgi:phage-related minor tail protein